MRKRTTISLLKKTRNIFNKSINTKKSNFLKILKKRKSNNILNKFSKINLIKGKYQKISNFFLPNLIYLKKIFKNPIYTYLYITQLIKIPLICQIEIINRRKKQYKIAAVHQNKSYSLGLKLLFSNALNRGEKSLKLKIINECLETLNFKSKTLLEKIDHFKLISKIYDTHEI